MQFCTSILFISHGHNQVRGQGSLFPLPKGRKGVCIILISLTHILITCFDRLDVLNTEIQETVQNKPVFDPDFHTELIIKDEFEDFDSGNLNFL